KVLLGIVRRSDGQAQLLGYPAGDRRGRQGVGYLPESHRIPRHLTGNSAMEYFGRLSGLGYRELRARRDALMARVGLSGWGRTSIRKYSKGMQQRLGLAQALLHDPPLLILDEPTDGVDPVGRSEMREVLRELKNEGKTIFINSHLLQEVELICSRVAIMFEGELRKEATVEELTELAGLQLSMQLACDEPTMRAALTGFTWAPAATSSPAGSLQHVIVELSQATEIDRCIDAVRQRGISIRAIDRQRRTLEQAFLDIIQGTRVEVSS
ncbi:MAG: ABC transporter ATP-binding protein, partial [Planctomycetales bacterium]|nr:ABC transporter ATP-binding protein [Planctomycetales bacterium]